MISSDGDNTNNHQFLLSMANDMKFLIQSGKFGSIMKGIVTGGQKQQDVGPWFKSSKGSRCKTDVAILNRRILYPAIMKVSTGESWGNLDENVQIKLLKLSANKIHLNRSYKAYSILRLFNYQIFSRIFVNPVSVKGYYATLFMSDKQQAKKKESTKASRLRRATIDGKKKKKTDDGKKKK